MIKTTWFKRSLSCLLGLGALVATASPSLAVVSTFNGGDPGEGLDLDGRFLYAVNARGPGGFFIDDAFFTSDQNNATAGYTHNAGAEILNWANPNYGATSNDNNLEVLMQSIRHGAPGQQHQVNLANLIVGREYKVQLMFTESCCDRGFDVSVNGVLVANDFNVKNTQGVITNAPINGALVTHSFVAASTTANILLNGAATSFTDKNPILSALTLEDQSGLLLAPMNVALNKPATATSSFNATFTPSKAVDGVTNDAQPFQWLAAGGVQTASLTIDLLSAYDVQEFQLLNTGNAGFLDRATGTFSIDVAGEDGIFSNAVVAKVLQHNTDGFQLESVNLGAVRYVRYNMLSIADPPGGLVGAAGGGLNEIRVIGVQTIPEPTTACLAVMGIAGLVMRRRRMA